MAVVDRITQHAPRLTPAERKVAQVLATQPEAVAFGTVAELARRAGTSGPSVVRLAIKLGYGGFVELQNEVQEELARQLAPARERIRQRPQDDVVERSLTAEVDNVQRTLAAAAPEVFRKAAARLADRRHQVFILPGDITLPVGSALFDQLSQLRDGVMLLAGGEVAVGRQLGALVAGDTVVTMDLRRYERWLIGVLQQATARRAHVIALTDSPLSPLASAADQVFLVGAQGAGPFDSLVGALALANALAADVAARLRQSAAGRLDAIEAAWAATGALVEGRPPDGDGSAGE
jgi:DNA-binding MurR/RpiR family transcriptional regulator